jgi:FlaA1/EpsC-like NDP-sugar epimerase
MVLDMGQPVRIIDLARNLIRLSGHIPNEDIPIEITGLKRGEKLNEELYCEGEDMELTRHPKIFVGHANDYSMIDVAVGRLAEAVERRDEAELRAVIDSFVADSDVVGSFPVSDPLEDHLATPSS